MGKGQFSWSKVLPGKGGACVFVGEGGGGRELRAEEVMVSSNCNLSDTSFNVL